MIARPEPAAAVARVRPFRPDDVPDVVGLRRRLYRFTERPSPAELADYCERVFCDNPWADDDLPSLVYEDQRGELAGFLGVLPRRMTFEDEPIRVAIATQLMVSPEARGLAGWHLVRAFMAGPQDLSVSDLGNEAARRLWESLGGSVSAAHSVTWEKALRPCSLAVSRLGKGALGRGAALAAQPLIALGDALVTAWPGAQERPAAGDTVPLTPATLTAAAAELLQTFSLRPDYDDGSLPWLLGQAAEKHEFGDLTGGLVRQPDGAVAGWFMHYVEPGHTCQVLQLAGRPAARALVLGHLLEDARRRGAIAVAGRLEPAWLPELAALGCALRDEGPWVLHHSRRPELTDAIERGDAFLSRLDGEWWLSF
ncbi:MAG TPA: GNAT family N-acetyltransferase [Gemmatimonadales bacterium]